MIPYTTPPQDIQYTVKATLYQTSGFKRIIRIYLKILIKANITTSNNKFLKSIVVKGSTKVMLVLRRLFKKSMIY